MKKSQQSLAESLEKIKYMMKYDSSKTRFENEGTVIMEQTKTGEMLGRTAKGAGIAAGAGYLGSAAAAGYTGMAGAGAAGTAIAAGAGIAGAATAGLAALGLIPLALWLNDKDKVRPKVEKLFKYISENKEKIDQVPRGLGDQEIWDASDKLFTAMKRLGTREKDVYEVFESLQTVSDLAELITFYEEDNGTSLFEDLDSDFDQTKEWMMIYKPIQKIVFKFMEQVKAEEEIKKEKEQIQKPESDDEKPPLKSIAPPISTIKDKINKTPGSTSTKSTTSDKPISKPNVEKEPMKPLSNKMQLAPAPTTPKKSLARSEYKQEKASDKFQAKQEKLGGKIKAKDDRLQAKVDKAQAKQNLAMNKLQSKQDRLTAKSDYKQAKTGAKVDYQRAKEKAKLA